MSKNVSFEWTFSYNFASKKRVVLLIGHPSLQLYRKLKKVVLLNTYKKKTFIHNYYEYRCIFKLSFWRTQINYK